MEQQFFLNWSCRVWRVDWSLPVVEGLPAPDGGAPSPAYDEHHFFRQGATVVQTGEKKRLCVRRELPPTEYFPYWRAESIITLPEDAVGPQVEMMGTIGPPSIEGWPTWRRARMELTLGRKRHVPDDDELVWLGMSLSRPDSTIRPEILDMLAQLFGTRKGSYLLKRLRYEKGLCAMPYAWFVANDMRIHFIADFLREDRGMAEEEMKAAWHDFVGQLTADQVDLGWRILRAGMKVITEGEIPEMALLHRVFLSKWPGYVDVSSPMPPFKTVKEVAESLVLGETFVYPG
jgi:hypothetical protein